MTRYVAFLRAINITGRFVRMQELRPLFESLGLTGVATYIQSGNVIFDAPQAPIAELEQAIEEQLQAALGFAVPTFVRRDTELVRIARYSPFADAPPAPRTTLFVAFLRGEPAAESHDALLTHASEIDALQLRGRDLFWLRRDHLGESTMTGARIERSLGMPATVRNISTVRKIVAKYGLDGDSSRA
jgi:uncharacterized protein (DUF1697 family)